MTGKPRTPPYDWARAILSVAKSDSVDIGELARVAELNPLAGDLSDIDLTDLDLSGQNFAGWDLRHAKLSNAKLSQTELRGATLDVRELIQAHDWENAELDPNLRAEATQLKEMFDTIPDLQFNPVLLKKVDELELSKRSMRVLEQDNVVYIGDMIQKTEAEVLGISEAGRKVLNEMKAVLAEMGLHFGMEVPGWPPENIEELAKRYED